MLVVVDVFFVFADTVKAMPRRNKSLSTRKKLEVCTTEVMLSRTPR